MLNTSLWADRLLECRDYVVALSGLSTYKAQKDILYYQILCDLLQSKGISKTLYPVSDGANPSLLYLIARVADEFEPENILELGAGQSTLLLNELASVKNISITTLENDQVWYNIVAAQVEQTILHAPLLETQILNVETKAYDKSVLNGEKFDLMIVDGPRGVSKYSRLGAFPFIDRNLKNEFVIIFDDAERRGEKETIALVVEELKRKGVELFVGKITGVKRQTVLCTKKYQGVLYF